MNRPYTYAVESMCNKLLKDTSVPGDQATLCYTTFASRLSYNQFAVLSLPVQEEIKAIVMEMDETVVYEYMLHLMTAMDDYIEDGWVALTTIVKNAAVRLRNSGCVSEEHALRIHPANPLEDNIDPVIVLLYVMWDVIQNYNVIKAGK